MKSDSRASATNGTPSSAVYAAEPNDSWNRIFACLFTRTVKTHLTAETNQGAPFGWIQYSQFPHDLSVSARLFDRLEVGDRAIEPLYPSFLTSVGVSQLLSEPLYSQFEGALADALQEKQVRPALARALMQSDAWAAYDQLYSNSYGGTAQNRQFLERRNHLLPLLAKLIKKLALTQTEVEALEDNYIAAASSHHLPALFDQTSGWLEVQWRAGREHDNSADFRRAARIFIKPISTPRNTHEFLNSLRNDPDIASKLEAVALVMQNLLIESDGKVVPSGITYDVQLRRFKKNARGSLAKTEIEEFEISRRLLLTQPASGGLVNFNNQAPAYLPSAGNDYGFASLQLNQRTDNSPILGTLQSRCVACHGKDVAVMFTFTTNVPTMSPPVAKLDPLRNERGFYVAQEKMQRDDFKSLRW